MVFNHLKMFLPIATTYGKLNIPLWKDDGYFKSHLVIWGGRTFPKGLVALFTLRLGFSKRIGHENPREKFLPWASVWGCTL